jgi:hypothetical protein
MLRTRCLNPATPSPATTVVVDYCDEEACSVNDKESHATWIKLIAKLYENDLLLWIGIPLFIQTNLSFRLGYPLARLLKNPVLASAPRTGHCRNRTP